MELNVLVSKVKIIISKERILLSLSLERVMESSSIIEFYREVIDLWSR